MFVKKGFISEEQRGALQYYYEERGEKPLFPSNGVSYVKDVLTAKPDQVIILNNRYVCGGTRKILRKKSDMWLTVSEFAIQYRAMKEALSILNKRGVPCFFFNRPGKMKGKIYSANAQYRMNKKLNFPKMVQDIGRYESEFKELLGDHFSHEYVSELTRIPQIIRKDNIYVHEDYESKLVNVKDGKRVVPNCPQDAPKHIYMYGRCGVFGYAVEDGENIPAYLQQCFLDENMNEYAVVNQGLWGAKDSNIIHNFLFSVSQMREGDIVIFYLQHFDFRILEKLEQEGLWFYNLTKPWHEFSESNWCFYDKPGHMNNIGYRNAARLIFDFMKAKNFSVKSVEEKKLTANFLNDYLKNVKDTEFETNITNYVKSICKDIPADVISQKCGSIVMNCNPFTKGHRYLIEQACNQVDNLFIFVVEENRSFFQFEDRFQMVKDGTSDLKNVYVVPSGKFIISALTFPEYFLKDYVKEKDFDVTNDLNIFCKYIAPALGIVKRFAGEEPFDPVTNNYNNEMKRILPTYGMEFVEIPRAQTNGGEVINATKVRQLLESGNIDALSTYIPDTTLQILKKKYVH